MSLQSYARQNVDHSIADARQQNPSMTASDVYRRISVAHNLSSQASQALSQTQATSYCQLQSAACRQQGGSYVTSGCGGGPYRGQLGTGGAGQQSLISVYDYNGEAAQKQAASTGSVAAYDAYWRSGARTSIDPVNESICVIPTFLTPRVWPYAQSWTQQMQTQAQNRTQVQNQTPPSSSSSWTWSMSSPTSVGPDPSTVDMHCYDSCRTYVGQSHGGAACATLCAVQPNQASQNMYPPSVMPVVPRFDADLPLDVGLDACLRQCDNVSSPEQMQACRFGCTGLTNAPPVFNNASGPCMLSCLNSCTTEGEAVTTCSNHCANACMGQEVQTAYATPSNTLQLGL